MHETWYVMEDGEPGDPADIARDATGILRHKDGRAVAYAAHGPRTRGGIDAVAERSRLADTAAAKKTETEAAAKKAAYEAAAKAAEIDAAKDIQTEEPKRGYKTRESKSD